MKVEIHYRELWPSDLLRVTSAVENTMRRILFVDDEQEFLDCLQRTFQPMRMQWNMEFVSSGQEALNTLTLRSFDVVVSDMKMPEMNGVELLDKVKEQCPQTTRIVLSGESDRKLIVRWIATGHLFLSKLCYMDKLMCILKGIGSIDNFANSTRRTHAGCGVVLHEGAIENIANLERTEESQQDSKTGYRTLFEDSGDAKWVMDEKGFVDCDSAALRMFGYPAGTLMLHPGDISPPNQPDGTNSRIAAQQRIASAFLNGRERFEWMHQRKNGDVFPAEVCLSALMLSERPMLLATVRDITKRKQFLAYYDALTELPHRALVQDRLEHALIGARRRGEKIALLFLSLDRFKVINDSYGFAFGDIVLKNIARRLKECIGEDDTVARVAGDEFLILLRSVDLADAAIAADRVMEMMNTSFLIQGRSLKVSCSIGVSLFPEHGEDGETLIRNADAAMSSAKDAGSGIVRFFTDEMNVQAAERLKMDKDLSAALARGEFFLVYQPQFEIESKRITGFEALTRWQHPDMGLIPPDKFIPIAENNGLILPLGEWVLRTACSQARRWQDAGLLAVPVAVNVSAIQFHQEGFPSLIRQVLQETHLQPHYLELEITESLLVSKGDATLSVLKELKNMGVKLAIDDFGTGYSCLSYLKQFPVDKLKIDRSFVRHIVVDWRDAAIASAIINMARSLHLKVIAEGVENEAQRSFLQAHRCDEVQGYYFSEPISADEAALLQAAMELNVRWSSSDSTDQLPN